MPFIRKSPLFAFVLFLWAALSFAQAPSAPLTLKVAIDLALLRNPEVLLAQAQLDELLGKVAEVRSGAFPQVSLEGFGLRLRDPSLLNSSSFDKLPEDFRNALVPRASNLFDLSLTVKQPLYNAGKVRTAVHLAEETRKERIAALAAARQRVAFKVFQAFHDLLLAEENLKVVGETLEQRRKHLDLARNRFNQGVATEIDVLRSEVNVANAEPELIRAGNRVRLARSALNNLIVVDLDSPTVISGRLEHQPLTVAAVSEIQKQGTQARPEIQSARQVVEESRYYLSLARAENRLGVDLDGRWGYNVRDPKNIFNSEFTRWSVTVNFKLPFYDGGRKAGLILQASARLKSAEQSLAQLENTVRLEIKAAYDDLESSAKAISASRLSVSQAERVLTMMQANYQYGAATTLDVVDSQTALTIARNTQINATYDYEIAKARLRLAAGSPILDGETHQP